MTAQEYILFALLLIYLVFTFLFAIKFRKKAMIYSPKQKRLHSILIWLIPFIWIILLKSLSKPTPGSHHYPNKKSDGGFDDNGMTSWGDGGGHDSGGH
jgi:hypothetical protein